MYFVYYCGWREFGSLQKFEARFCFTFGISDDAGKAFSGVVILGPEYKTHPLVNCEDLTCSNDTYPANHVELGSIREVTFLHS